MFRRGFVLGGLMAALTTAATAEDFTTLKGHGGPIMGIAVSDAGQVASASFDNAAALWTGGSPVWLDRHDAAVTAVAFVDETQLVTGGDDFAVVLWQGNQAMLLGHHLGKVRAVAVSADRAWVASASWDGTIGLWSLAAAEHRSLHVGSGVNDIAFAADGRLFAATMDGRILRFEGDAGDVVPVVEHGFGINRLILGPDDAWLAYGAVDGVTRIVDPDSGAAIADVSLDRRPILALAHHGGAGRLAVGDGHGYIMLLDTKTWQVERDFRAMSHGPIWALAFATDGETVFAGGLDNVVFGWPVALMESVAQTDGAGRSFLRDVSEMPNGERQFMRKCSICHDLKPSSNRKAGPNLTGLFGRPAGTLDDYRYSDTLLEAKFVWSEQTIDALFDLGPDHFIPGSKMPMQRIVGDQDRKDLIAFLKQATEPEK